MKVVIETAVANDPAAWRWLVRIQATFEDGWHLWSCEPEDQADLESSAWLEDPGYAGRSAREILRKCILRGSYPSKLHRQLVRVSQETDSKRLNFNPEDANQFLGQELVLLVEERSADGDFLKTVIRLLGDDELKKHLQELSRPAWKVDSRGGKGKMPEEIRKCCQAHVPPRIMILRDSDRCAPASPELEDVTKLRALCEEADIPCWILRKREIENYLPACLLVRRIEPGQPMTQVFEAWQRLTPEQKDFLDLKKGLLDNKDAAYAGLLADLPGDHRATLEKGGFGPKVGAALWRLAANDDAALSADDLRQRDGIGELDQLLAKLREQL